MVIPVGASYCGKVGRYRMPDRGESLRQAGGTIAEPPYPWKGRLTAIGRNAPITSTWLQFTIGDSRLTFGSGSLSQTSFSSFQITCTAPRIYW